MRPLTIAAALSVVLAFNTAAAQSGQLALDNPARLADSLYNAGSFSAAAKAYETLASQSRLPRYWAQLGMSAYNLRDYARAASAFERAVVAGAGGGAMYNAGAMHAKMGHADDAFRWLTKADSAGFIMLTLLSSDDDLVPIRPDARFASLVAAAKRTVLPCESNEDATRMNFWIGEWDVRAPNGQPAGSSSIQAVSGNCGIYENWIDTRGTMGKSLSAWNSARKQWQQFWIAQNGGITEYRQGQWTNGSMVFIAESVNPAGGTTLTRMTFTPKSSDIVRQLFETSTDEGKTWTIGGDLTYNRKPR